MSCFIVKPESVSALARFVTDTLNCGYEYSGFTVRDNLRKALSDCRDPYNFFICERIYETLYALNISAYNERYTGEGILPDTPLVPYEPNTHHKPAEWPGGHYAVEPWHYQMLKRLDCFLYQCDEGNAAKTPLFAALTELRNDFCSFIAQNSPLYADAPWE